jgi:hypothetical protein
MSRKVAVVLLIALVSSLPLSGKKNRVSPNCVEEGCVITLKSTAMFLENRDDLTWEYSPAVPSRGPVKIRGTSRKFLVVEVKGDKVLTSGEKFFPEEAHIWSFNREELKNQKVFEVSN